ncbi:MAG: gliding motility-associated C-terminal domain-containing protein [Ferruginibacter sp.]
MKTPFLILLVTLFPLLSRGQLIENYDTCRTQTYYQYIGNAASETHLEKARTVQDNGIINAGYIRQGTSQNALIIKQDVQGRVIWQKEYGTAGYDEKFTDWRELPNRELLAGGVAKNKITQQSVFFMMQFTADGNILWQKSYANITAANINNAKIYPDFYGEYFFAAETDSSIIYGMTSNTGNVNWFKCLDASPGTKLVAAISDYSKLLIATNALDSGRKVANIYFVNYYWIGHPQLIKYTTKLGGVHQNADYILHDAEQYGQFTYFSGIRSVGNQPYEVIRVNINQGYIHEALENIVTPGVAIDSLTQTAINIYGNAVSFSAGAKNNRLHTLRLTGSENFPTSVIWSATYLLPDSLQLKGNIKTWDDGYIFFGFKELPGGNKKVIQLKTDSASLTAGCIVRQAGNFSAVRNTFPTDTVRYSYNSLHGLNPFSYTAATGISNIDTATVCRELKCPQLPLTDSCLDSYRKVYVTYEPSVTPTGIQIINGRVFVSGRVQPMDYVPERSNSFIAEMNKNGQVINQKKYVIGIGSETKLFKTLDNNLLLYGFTSDSAYYPSIMLAKIDTNLNVLWIKTLRLSTTPQYASNQKAGDVKQGSDGSYFIQYSDGETFGATVLYLTKLDGNGGLLWTKAYRASYPGEANLITGKKLEVAGGYVYIMSDNVYNAYAASILLKVTENNGNLIWCKKYSNAADYLDLKGMINSFNNELVLGGTYSSGTDFRNIIVKASTDGNIISSISLANTATNTAPVMQFMHYPDGDIYMGGAYYNAPPYGDPYRINVRLNSNLNIIASKKRGAPFDYNGGSMLAVAQNGQLYETSAYPSNNNLYNLLCLIKFSADGRVGTCPSDTMLLQPVTPPAISVTDISCIVSDTVIAQRTPVYRAEQFFLATSKLICASVPGCNNVHVSGSDSICDRSRQYTFHAVRNNGCMAPVQWIFDNTNIQMINVTDSTITFQFLAGGSLLLKARLTSNCIPYTDSLLIHILGNAPVLNLGSDTVLCQGATLLLNAKKGFRTYLWQDGSSDSTFTVTSAGLYYVTVTDSCGNLFSDSIHVQYNNSSIVLNLGPDSNFCNTNSILLNAHSGFLHYQWQDGSTDSVFTATQPGLYYVNVTDACGNIFSDTVKLSAYRRAATLNLGTDTIFCNSVSLLLHAGPGFKNYAWQDGSTDSVFLALNTGLYYVTVTDSCGSVSADSIHLWPDTETVVFDIGPNTAICKTDTALLQVNPTLNNYTWWPLANTLPQGPASIKVFPGVSTWYYVSATKHNGCPVTDSIFVTVHIPPSINLGADRNLCAGDTLQLDAGPGFINYTWSTGEHTASIPVYQAGLYYVTATDANSCKSGDSLLILQLIPLPVSQLPAETTICQGQPKILHAGTGFTSYLWNTGALTESINVSSIGQYWVTISNAAGCKKTDTVRISKEFALPADFLKYRDSTICKYETITIAPTQNFVSYLWSTGSTAPSVILSEPGDYWLKVTDLNGCTGSDSFRLAKKICFSEVYFPNSFTPNNDGKNDVYKPVAYGDLAFYHFSIFSRYGELLFDSRNIAEGWNGEFKGAKQGNGAYIWQCSYQLSGKDMQNSSGAFMLIR